MKPIPVVKFERPNFPDADSYIENVRHHLTVGRAPWGPANRAELEALVDFDRRLAQRLRPCAETLKYWGLPADFTDPIVPWAQREQDRFLHTVEQDDQFRAALKALLGVSW